MHQQAIPDAVYPQRRWLDKHFLFDFMQANIVL
jgi:hypothetical protein